MTTIAWDGKTLAADKRACFGGNIQVVTKIHRAQGCLVAGSGELSFILAMVEWVKKGRDPAAFPASQRDKDDWQPTLVIEPDGAVLLYERTPHPIRWERLPCAIGSGRDFALATMHLGRSPQEAIAVAAEFDSGTGNGVNSMQL